MTVRALVTFLPCFLLPLQRVATQRDGCCHVYALVDAGASRRPQEKILLSSVQSLTFSEDDVTQSRIGEPVPKLLCSGGDCLGGEPGRSVVGRISQALCQNVGLDDTGRPAWRCTASLPKGCKFRTTEVSCEGWSGPDDEYVVQGSCAFRYSTLCGRTEEAQREEAELRRRVKSERGRQQDAALAEVERQRGQAARDECELKVAGALYPIGQEVEIDVNAALGASGMSRSDAEPFWTRGYVGHIDCDGRYRVDFWSKWRESIHNVRESNLRVAVDPIYLQEDMDTRAYYSFRDGSSARSSRFNHSAKVATDAFLKMVSFGFLLVLASFFCCCRCCPGLFTPTLTESSIVKCLYDSPGHRLPMRDIRARFRAAIDGANSLGPPGCGDEKLWGILSNVAVEDGYADNSGCPPAGVPRADDMFFRLRPDHIAREQQRERDRLERERRERERRERERRDYERCERERRDRDRYMYGHSGGYQDRFERGRRYGQNWQDQERRERQRFGRDWRDQEMREQDRHEQEMRQRRKAEPRSQNITQRPGARVDEAAMERQREAKTKILAAQAELRVAKVKAKQDRAEAARIQEYQTKIEQMQRDIENDTSQLGNVMQRFDALMEEYEAVGVASTKMR